MCGKMQIKRCLNIINNFIILFKRTFARNIRNLEVLKRPGRIRWWNKKFQRAGPLQYAEQEIHMAGLICAYLESIRSSPVAKAAFADVLTAIRKKSRIFGAFQDLEAALIEDEKNLRAFMTDI